MNQNELLNQNLQSLDLPPELGILGIEADPDGMEYLDYSVTLNILVEFRDGKEGYTVISYDFLSSVIAKCVSENRDVHTFGKPLLMVGSITAEAILLALKKHLLQEELFYGTDSFRRPAVPRAR